METEEELLLGVSEGLDIDGLEILQMHIRIVVCIFESDAMEEFVPSLDVIKIGGEIDTMVEVG